MRAIILAAGFGRRLAQSAPPGIEPPPKCLLRFDGVTLLERHLRLLREVGIGEVVIVGGYAHAQIAAELDRIDWTPRPAIVINERFKLGSVLSVQVATQSLVAGGDVLLMDADVLYDRRMLEALVKDAQADRLLQDRGFTPGDEPVKLCTKNGRPVELRKRVAEGLDYDAVGESVGFFRFTHPTAQRFADIVHQYIQQDRADQPHEEAVRDLLLERGQVFDTADITGLPWLEIDFPADVIRAQNEVLPKLQPLAAN